MWPFKSKNHFIVDHKLCVISGGSQGVGAEIAKRLVKENADVIIVARTETKLKAKVEELEQYRIREDQRIEYATADLSIYEECTKVFANSNNIPDVVICCAGSAKPGVFADLTGEDLTNGVTLNYNTALYFSHAAFKQMMKKPIGAKKHIVFFSSVVAFFSFIGYGQYSPSKAAIRSLADTLRQEGLPYNISTSCVFPGNFDSEGFAEENLTKPEITKIIEGPSEPISCERCSDIVISQLQKGTTFITTDFIGYFLSCMMLSNSPRNWWPVQLLFCIVLTIVAPILNLVMNLQIMNYFNSHSKKD